MKVLTEFNKLPFHTNTQGFFYAGIGSRETPIYILHEMTTIAKYLESIGYILRSGGAIGADQAFERNIGLDKKQIFLATDDHYRTPGREHMIAREIHRNPKALDASLHKDYFWKLMARNTNQIFGKNLDSPVDFVLCWTRDGITHHDDRTKYTGGTGQAIELASRKDIPIINMYNKDWKEKLVYLLENIGKSKNPTLW